jgi:hypothetical protein
MAIPAMSMALLTVEASNVLPVAWGDVVIVFIRCGLGK